MAGPRDVVEAGHIRLYRAPAAVMTEAVKVGLGLAAFWILKDWLFSKVYGLTGWQFAKNWAGIGFLFWPAIIIAGLIILGSVIRWFTNYYELWPNRLVIKTGVFSIVKRTIDVNQFAGLEVSQNWWGRLWGYGNIILMFEAMTTIITEKSIVLSGIRQPQEMVTTAATFIRRGGTETAPPEQTGKKAAVIEGEIQI